MSLFVPKPIKKVSEEDSWYSALSAAFKKNGLKVRIGALLLVNDTDFIFPGETSNIFRWHRRKGSQRAGHPHHRFPSQ